jgi:hypothetical protein
MADEMPKLAKEDRAKYGEQDEWGNSIASLRNNLRLTPLERLIRADRFGKSVNELLHALKPTKR